MRKMSVFSAKAFSLLELMVVLIIVGILATIAIVQFSGPKESALEKEAKANLKLIAAAEKIYRMESGTYISLADEAAINQYLRLMLPHPTTGKNWDYSVGTASANAFDASAVRTSGPMIRTYHINETSE
jgi:general secretion pathway protein G